MPPLRDIMAYFCQHYPYKDDLSNARLTKMVYLADWVSVLRHGRQLTGINWIFNNYGPYVRDVIDTARTDPTFEVKLTSNYFGDPKEVISVQEDLRHLSLGKNDLETLSFVVEKTRARNWSEFIQLIYSTYPIVSQPRYSKLDLIALAKEYKESLPFLRAATDVDSAGVQDSKPLLRPLSPT